MTNVTAETLDGPRRAGMAWLRSLQQAFKQLYVRSFFTSVSLQALVVMVLIEAVFLAERFPMVFRDVLKNNADLFDTSMIFALTSTQIFDLALAIAILMAVYWTSLRMRESRELLVLFTAGIGPYQLTALTLVIAVAAQMGSLTVSSVIDPASRYAQRVVLFDAEFRALRNGISAGQFHYFPNRVAFAPAHSTAARDPADSAHSQNLFVYEDVDPGTFRVITADRARLDGPNSSGNILLKLGGFTSRLFSDVPQPANAAPAAQADAKACADCPDPDQQQGELYASDVTREMKVDELLPFDARGSETAELTIFDQLGRTDPASPRHQEEMRLLGERFARSLLCLLAPLIALGSVCLTSRATNYFVLPLACMILMALNVASETLIRAIAPTGPFQALAVPAALTAIAMALLLALIVGKQSDLVRPKMSRA